MRKILGTLTILVGLSALSFSQDITFKIKGAEDSTMFLIRFYGSKLYYADTAQADKTGKFTFDSQWANKPGMYSVMAKSQKRFDVILNKEDVYIETAMSDPVGNMVVKKSKENQLFYDYIAFIGKERRNRERISKQLENTKEGPKKDALKKEVEAIDKKVVQYQKDFVKNNEGTLVSKVVNMSMEIEVPDPPKDENGVVTDSSFQRNYYVSHYWDHFDLNDDALTRMAAFEKRLNNLFDNILVKQQDSLIEYADRMISRLDTSSDIFKMTVVTVTSKYQQSKIMCLDAVFVHMVLKYYKTGLAKWMPKDKNKEIVERAEAMAPNLCQKRPHNISLMDSAGNWIRLGSLTNRYVVLMFWAPDCGHCKKEMPKLKEKYDTWKKEGIDVEIYAVSKRVDDEWKKFIKENELSWINVAIPVQVFEDQDYVNQVVRSGKSDVKSMNYHDTFDIYKTPTIYLLNKERYIRGKNLEADGLDDLIHRMLEKGD